MGFLEGTSGTAEVPPRSASRVSLPPPSPQWGSGVGSDPASAPRLLICKMGTATTPAARTAGPQSSGAGGEWEPGAGGLPAGAEEGARRSPGAGRSRTSPSAHLHLAGVRTAPLGLGLLSHLCCPPGAHAQGTAWEWRGWDSNPGPLAGDAAVNSPGAEGTQAQLCPSSRDMGAWGVRGGSSRDLLGPRGGCSPPHAPARPELHLSPRSLCGWGRGGARAADCAESASEFYRPRGVGAAGLPAQPLQPPEPPAQPP